MNKKKYRHRNIIVIIDLIKKKKNEYFKLKYLHTVLVLIKVPTYYTKLTVLLSSLTIIVFRKIILLLFIHIKRTLYTHFLKDII